MFVPRHRQAVIVAGLRTPFARAGTFFKNASAVALARFAARELLYRSGLDASERQSWIRL
jgi:acetyl-CoA acetyltransferase